MTRLLIGLGVFALLGIFITQGILTHVPQFTLAQLSLNMTNATSLGKPQLTTRSPQLITDLPDSLIIHDPGNDDKFPKLSPNATAGLIISDPRGDDVFTKDCKYAGRTYSPGAVVAMGQPPQNKTCMPEGVWV
jgi:hypothetical protein